MADEADAWHKVYLNPDDQSLCAAEPEGQGPTISFDAMGDGVTFLTAPAPEDRDHRAVLAEALRVIVDQRRRPLRGVPRVLAGIKEVVFQGAIDPHTPIGQGWLRASHRKLDKKLSSPSGRITPTTRSSP